MRAHDEKKRTGMTYPMQRRDPLGENDAKTQASLAMGTTAYRNYQMAQAGLNPEDFTGDAKGKAFMGDTVLPEEALEAQEQAGLGIESEHVGEFRAELSAAHEASSEVAEDLYALKSMRKGYKRELIPEMKATMTEVAAQTETKADDRVAESVSKRNCDDMPEIHDDSIGEEEYIPKAIRKYMS